MESDLRSAYRRVQELGKDIEYSSSLRICSSGAYWCHFEMPETEILESDMDFCIPSFSVVVH